MCVTKDHRKEELFSEEKIVSPLRVLRFCCGGAGTHGFIDICFFYYGDC